MTSPHVVVIGLDACDPVLALHFAAQGRMPFLQRLLERSTRCPVRPPTGVFVGAVWRTFATGQVASRHGFRCWDEIDVASYERRLVVLPECPDPIWRTVSEAGRRVAVFDVPHARAAPVHGVHVQEWGCHDRHYGLQTWPLNRASDVEAAFGVHPVLGLDPHAERDFASDDYALRAGPYRTLDEDRAFFDGLLRGLATKRALTRALVQEDDHELVVAVLGEGHAVGHQQWHFHDPRHPRHDPSAAAALGADPVARVYEELDASVGDQLAMADADTTVLVLFSHGMGPHYDGTHLLEGVLERLDAADRFPGRWSTRGRRLAAAVGVLPVPRSSGPRKRPSKEFASPARRARQRFFLEPNNSAFAGVRVNLEGREPLGRVRAGEFDAVCRRIATHLKELVHLDTGRPVVRDVHRSDRWHRRTPSDTMPDLFVEWERDAPVETVWSPATGVVHAPYTNWRTGDHRPHALLLASGPGLAGGRERPEIATEDLAPAIAARLGVSLADVDGRAPDWLAPPRRA